MLAASGTALAQVNPDAELRREQEREQAARRLQERTPDVRLMPPAAAPSARLPIDEKPCFVIRSIALDGDAAPRFTWLLDELDGAAHDDAPQGRCLGAGGVEQVMKRAQDALVAHGYVTSRILAQGQDLSTGALTLTLIPGRIHRIRFAEPGDGRGNFWNALPAGMGDILNLRDIEQALENMKRSPSSEADIKIEPASDPQAPPGSSDLVIRYQQPMPFRLSFSADDSGGKATGKYQGGLTFSYDNSLTLNDLFYLTLNQDLGGGEPGGRGTHGYVAHYSIPYGYWLLALTASRNDYYQTVAGATQNYIYSGSSDNAEIKLSRLVHRDNKGKTTLGVKAFQRKSNNFIDDTEVDVQRRVVGGWEASIEHKRTIGPATLEAALSYKRGTGAFGSLPAPEENFGEGTSRFALAAANATLAWPFALGGAQWRYNGEWRRQWPRSPLTPQDRFGIGGRFTVRGFDGEASLSAEGGWLIRNDLGLALADSGQEFYAGIDHGEVSGPSVDTLAGRRLTGAVLGLRGSLGKLQYDFFVGSPLRKPDAFRTASSTTGIRINWSI